MNIEGTKRYGIVLAAPKSGSGKTLITCAVIQALSNRRKPVCSYKCGPDYIDPMFHRTVLGIPGGNLDTFFTGKQKTQELFLADTNSESLAVVEGVMGLYDGLGGVREEGSTYDLARTLGLPVILIIDAHGMGRSILPIIAGFLTYDTAHLIKGVILNRVSASFYPALAELIQQECSIEVLGFFPQQKDINLESRHLGLKMPEEIKDLKEQVEKSAKELEKTVNVERMIELSGRKGAWDQEVQFKNDEDEGIDRNAVATFHADQRPVLAVARDEAFCFYYQENVRMLKEIGFEIAEFSPIHDHRLPDNTCAILLGGGYPELFAKELSTNQTMRQAVKAAIQNGMPSVAECGGFMYLHKELTDDKGNTYEMANVIEESCSYQGKLVRFGYVDIEEKVSTFLPQNEMIKGHEFHYYDSTYNGDCCVARKPVGSRSWNCVWEEDTHWWGFPHLYYPSNQAFVEHFYRVAVEYQQRKNNRIH